MGDGQRPTEGDSRLRGRLRGSQTDSTEVDSLTSQVGQLWSAVGTCVGSSHDNFEIKLPLTLIFAMAVHLNRN